MKKYLYLIICLLFTVVVQAQNILYVSQIGAGTNDGSSWANAMPATSLQTAINTVSIPGQVWVTKGEYDLTSSLTMKDDVSIYGGFEGTETNLSQRNLITDTTILLGSNIKVVINNTTTLQTTAEINNFTINGPNGGVTSQGGTFKNCTITGATSTWGGYEAIYSSTATFTNCTISGNVYGINSDGTFINCLITGNNTGLQQGTTASFINCTIAGNATNVNWTGGTYTNCIVWGGHFSNATISYCALTDNYTGTGNIVISTINTDVTGPQFVDPDNGNYHLLSNSPLINLGLDAINTSTTDREGRTRIINGSIDLGAYEYGIEVNVSILGADNKPVAYSNVKHNGETYIANGNGIATFDVDPNSTGSFFASSAYYSDTVKGQYSVALTNVPVTVSLKNKKTINILYVNTSGTGKGTSWVDALPVDSLQYAINNVTIPGEVWVAKGTYNLTSVLTMRNDVAVYGGFNGTETDLNLQDATSNVTILSGTNVEYVIKNTSTTLLGSALLDGFTINEGTTGGIYSLGALFNNCIISGTSYAITTSTGTFTNCSISGSTGIYSSSGIYNNCIISEGNFGVDSGTGIFTNCTISNTSSYSACVYNSAGTFNNCIIKNSNTSGIGIEYGSGFFTNCKVIGGGVSNSPSTFINCLISNCSNGIWQQGTFINCTIVSNTTGLSLFAGTLTNCIVWGNTNNSLNSPTITYTAMPGVIDGDGNIDLAKINSDSDGPQFVDPVNGDYHLTANSTLLIDAGLNAANTSTTDIEGKQRIIGNSIDLGAYERGIDVSLTVLGTNAEAVTNAIIVYNGISYKTNSNGIAIINIVPGTISFTITSADYTDTIKTSFTVTAALSKTVSFTTLRQDVHIAVLGTDKKPLPNATVHFDKKSFITDSKGIVIIENIIQGTHLFYVTSDLYSDTATSSLTVANSEVFDTIQLNVRRQNVSITVLDANGNPLTYADVFFNKINYSTDSTGKVILTNIATGTYSVAAGSVYYVDTVQGTFSVTNLEVFDTLKLTTPKPITIIRFTKNGAGTKDGSSWTNAAAMTSIQAKINAVVQPAQLWVKAGSYTRTTALAMRDLVSIYGGFSGAETGLDERDAVNNITTFDGGSSVNYLIYNNSTLQSTARLDGFTITGGSTGGIYSFGGTFKNCTITANSNYGVASSTGTFINCGITANPYGVYSSTGIFINCSISNNTTNGVDASSGTFINCTIKGNETGIFGSSGLFTSCSISNNTSYGIYNNEGDYTNCIITGNYSGIYSSNATLTNCNITDNTSGIESGSGIFTNCTITNGIYNSAGTYTNCIAWNNNNTFNMGSSINYTAITNGYTGTGNISLSTINTDATGPHFVDPTKGNYRLAANSPLIDAGIGSVNTTTKDLDGKPRIIGSSIDIGAYEHGIDVSVTILGIDNKPLTNAIVTYNKVAYGTNDKGIASFDAIPNSSGSFYASSLYYTDTVTGSFTVVNSGITKTVQLTSVKPVTILKVTTDGAGTKDGSTWENAIAGTNLQTAITTINIPGQIWVAKGTYPLTKSITTRNDVAIYGGFVGTESDLNSRDVTTNETILNGSKMIDYIINNSDSVNSTAIVDGFTITKAMYGGITSKGGIFANCNITKDSTYGVYNSTGSFNNCILSNNQFGISNSSGIFTNNTIVNNSNYGVAYSSGRFSNCTISNSLSYGVAYSSGTFTNCLITGNSDGVNNSTGIFINCSIVKNKNMGIYSNCGTFTNCISWGNTSNEYIEGTAIMNYSATSAGLIGTDNITLATDNSVTTGPHFVDPVNGDFHLAAGSPCINTGLNSANTTTNDIEGNQRITGSSIDMGAYERGLYVDINITVKGSDAKPMSNAIVIYKGSNYATNGNGIASFKVIANSSGVFTVISDSYSDTIKGTYTAVTSDVPVTVAFTTPYLHVNVIINGSDNVPLSGVTVSYNGNVYITDNNGSVKFDVTANSTGSFSAVSDSYFDTINSNFTVHSSDISETVAFKNVKPSTLIASNELATTELFTKWYEFNDVNNGGSSTIAFSKITPGAYGTDSTVQVTYSLDKGNNINSPYIGIGFTTMVDSTKSYDFTSASGISFYHKGNACSFSIILPQNIGSDANYDYYHVSVPSHSEWTKVSYSWSNFAMDGWGSKYTFDASNINSLEWQVKGSTGNAGTFYIDQVALENVALTLLSVSENKASILADGGSTTAYLCSNTAWTATSDQSWLTLDKSTGTSGTAKLVCSAIPNSGAIRTATITISAGDKTQLITVTQQESGATLDVSSSSLTVGYAKGSTTSVVVTSTVSWTANSNESSCIINPSSGTAGTTTVTFTAGDENTTSLSRSAFVTFSINGIEFKTITITQDAAPVYTLSFSPTVANIDATVNSSIKITVSSNTSWNASSDQSWLTVSQNTTSGDGLLTLTAITANTSTTVRTAIVTVVAGTITKTITISQQIPFNNKPIVSAIPSQSISGSEVYTDITLSNYVTDIETPAKDITWTASKSDYLTVSIVNGIATITPKPLWNGTETIQFIAKDAQNATDTVEVEFTRSQALGSQTGKPSGSFTVEKQVVSTGTALVFSLNSIGASSYAWTFNGGSPSEAQTASPSVVYSKPGIYDVSLSLLNSNGITNIVKTGYITVMGIEQQDTVICKSKSITISLINATSADSVKWNTGSNATSITVLPIGDTTLTATFFVGLFKYTSSIKIKIAQPVSLGKVSSDGSICVGTSQVLSPGSYISYIWQDASTQSTFPIDTKNAKTYSVTVTDQYGCTSSDEVTVSGIKPLPVTGLQKTNFICAGSSIDLIASGGISYIWTDEFNTKLSTSSNIHASKAGKYIVSVTGSNACTINDTATVIVNQLPSITTQASKTTICKGDSINFTSKGGLTYIWSNGISDGSRFALTVSGNNIFTVTGIDVNGCKNTTTSTIIVNDKPVLSIASKRVEVCRGQELTLNAAGAPTITWNNNIINGQAFTPANDETYIATGTTKEGCSDTLHVSVVINALPTINATATAQSVCRFGSITLQGSGAKTYKWSNNIKNNSSFIADTTTVYTVTGTDNNGCQSTNSIAVEVLRPYKEQIGVVTYDTLWGKKVIIAWNRHDNKRTERYILFRDNGKNGWDSIAGIAFNKSSIIVDSTADLDLKAYRYKLVTIDETCHNQDSSIHRTMHVSSLLRSDGGIDIQWNTYIGYASIAYTVVRYNPNGTSTKITDQSGDADILTVTDKNPVKGGKYRILYSLPEIINPSLLKSDSGPFSQSLSNLAESELTDIESIHEENIVLSPNPTTDFVTVSVSTHLPFSIDVVDILGHLVTSQSGIESIKLDCTLFSKGVYFVKIYSGNNVITRRLIYE